MTVTFRGEERTPAQMAPFLEENDRSVRQTAWELVAERRLADRDTLDDALRPDARAPRGDRARGGLPRLRRLRLPVPRAVRLRRAGNDRLPPGDRAGRGPAGQPAPGGASPGAGGRDAPAVGPGGRPAGPAAAEAVPRRRAIGRGGRGDLHECRPRPGRAVRLHAVARPARPGQPQGEGPRRLSDDARGRPAAVHLHERRGPGRRRAHPAARGGPRVPRPGQSGRAAGRLPREPDRVLRGRLDGDGTARRPRPRAVLRRPGRRTARTASSWRGSS